MATIEELLHRRVDLSTFLVHLTKRTPHDDGSGALRSILQSRIIEARSAFGMAPVDVRAALEGTVASQHCVCFTETPLEHIWMMVQDIDGRSVNFAPYGLVVSKTTARTSAVNPVWYIDITPGNGRDWLTKPINELVEAAIAGCRGLDGFLDVDVLTRSPIFQITPFVEQMGLTQRTRKEFWWEREWRRVHAFHLRPRGVVAILAPESEHDTWRSEIAGYDSQWERRNVPLLDPLWGQERMIGAMSGVNEGDLGPFPR